MRKGRVRPRLLWCPLILPLMYFASNSEKPKFRVLLGWSEHLQGVFGVVVVIVILDNEFRMHDIYAVT